MLRMFITVLFIVAKLSNNSRDNMVGYINDGIVYKIENEQLQLLTTMQMNATNTMAHGRSQKKTSYWLISCIQGVEKTGLQL